MNLLNLALAFIGPMIIVPLTNLVSDYLPGKTKRQKRFKGVIIPLVVLAEAALATILVNLIFSLQMSREEIGLQIFGLNLLSQITNEATKEIKSDVDADSA